MNMDIVPMSKQELAQMYAPDLTPRAAVNRLAKWIKINPALVKALEAAGYVKQSKIFTSKQVKIIMEYLGEP